MLKRIATKDLQLGMFLQAMEGSWLSHPFWKTRFVIRDPADIAALRASRVQEVWIDVSRGLDAPAAEAGLSTPTLSLTEPPLGQSGIPTDSPEPSALVSALPPSRSGIEDEFGRAAEVLARGKTAVMALFAEARLGKAVNSDACLPIVDEISTSLARNPSAFVSLARLKTRDDYTYMHSVAVCGLMVSLARQVGLSDEQVREAGLAGLLHDVGKMMMPLEVLNKPGALTDAEFDIMRSHPVRGWELLRNGAQVPDAALDVCLHHHEKMDGTGYPNRLAGDDISLLARMGAVCDVYDAITSTRPYKSAWDPAGSLQRMAQWKGQFDPVIFQAFVKSVGIYPVGTLVKLESGRLAVVIDQHEASLTTPRVKVFFSTKSNMPIPVQLLDLAAQNVNDRIVGRESASDWGFTHLDTIWSSF